MIANLMMPDNAAHHGNNVPTKQNNNNLSMRDRLLSIHYDVQHFVLPFVQGLVHESESTVPLLVIANQRCGGWYLDALEYQQEITQSKICTSANPSNGLRDCYFKSTDGHVNVWNVSLKRLNLGLLEQLAANNGTRIILLLDASAGKRKVYPDSFARTLPIWAATMNRLALEWRNGTQSDTMLDSWDTNLYLPETISPQEHEQIERILPERVQDLISSRAIVHPETFLQQMTKPIRCLWVAPNSAHGSMKEAAQHLSQQIRQLKSKFHLLVCVSCSNPSLRNQILESSFFLGEDKIAFRYIPGAGDDQESWAAKVGSSVALWKHMAGMSNRQLWTAKDESELVPFLRKLSHGESHEAVSPLDGYFQVLSASNNKEQLAEGSTLGQLMVGSRRSGRPRDCWMYADAILNVTMDEYEGMGRQQSDKFYLQLPVPEGKQSKTTLEAWMTVGIVYVVWHLGHGRSVLIHCAQGKDRSVAVAMAVITLFGDTTTYPWHWKARQMVALVKWIQEFADEEEKVATANASGLPDSLVPKLFGRPGRNLLLDWIHSYHGREGNQARPNLASKDSLRRVLHFIKQDRPEAEPSRSTMQKLNRYFMSAEFEQDGRTLS